MYYFPIQKQHHEDKEPVQIQPAQYQDWHLNMVKENFEPTY